MLQASCNSVLPWQVIADQLRRPICIQSKCAANARGGPQYVHSMYPEQGAQEDTAEEMEINCEN